MSLSRSGSQPTRTHVSSLDCPCAARRRPPPTRATLSCVSISLRLLHSPPTLLGRAEPCP